MATKKRFGLRIEPAVFIPSAIIIIGIVILISAAPGMAGAVLAALVTASHVGRAASPDAVPGVVPPGAERAVGRLQRPSGPESKCVSAPLKGPVKGL